MTRGIRNNNPLNIRYNPNNKWEGSVFLLGSPTHLCGGESGGTGRPLIKRSGINNCEPVAERDDFEEFETMRHGFRAALLLIQTYIIKYGCNTISKIIARWAPPTDNNNTAKYIADVCKMVNMGGNEVFSNHDPRLKDIVRAMSLIESGTDIRNYWGALDVAWDEFKPKSVYQKERKPVGRIK